VKKTPRERDRQREMLLIIGDQRKSKERVSASFPVPCNRGTFNVLSGKDTDR
jgi:hypothetical protein